MIMGSFNKNNYFGGIDISGSQSKVCKIDFTKNLIKSPIIGEDVEPLGNYTTEEGYNLKSGSFKWLRSGWVEIRPYPLDNSIGMLCIKAATHGAQSMSYIVSGLIKGEYTLSFKFHTPVVSHDSSLNIIDIGFDADNITADDISILVDGVSKPILFGYGNVGIELPTGAYGWRTCMLKMKIPHDFTNEEYLEIHLYTTPDVLPSQSWSELNVALPSLILTK